MTPNETNVQAFLEPAIEAVMDKHDPIIGEVEDDFRNLIDLEPDTPAELAFENMHMALMAMFAQGIEYAFWTGVAYANGVEMGAGEVMDDEGLAIDTD